MDLNTIAEELFAKIRGRFPSITIGDEEGNVTNEPADARYFEFTFKEGDSDGNKISVSLDQEDGVVIMYAEDVSENELGKDRWYDFLREIRVFAKKRMLNFDVRNITKSNLDKRDYQYLSRSSGDSSMNESKLYGTSKLSYQDVDSARLVIKHTENVDYESPAGRTRNIGAIYIESAEGERFKYPFKHLAGARAMARHVAEGGTTYDDFGHHIVDLSEEMSKLRKFKSYMGRSKVMAESLADYMGVVHERIGTVKKRIDSLQKKQYYQEAFEGFEKPVFEDIPDDVAENWIDQLTIRQFNEELKDVFPYIYKLIGEATRAKELGPEDFMSESEEDDEDVEEGAMGNLGKKLAKAFWWDKEYSSPEKMKQRVSSYSDQELKSLAGEVKGNPSKYSPRDLQTKLISREMKRRRGATTEAGNKPVEKSIGMGDTRSAQELKQQIRDLDDKTLAVWAKKKPGMLHSSVAKMQYKLVQSELRRRSGQSTSEAVDEDPCWKDYKQVGMKKKGGKEVPNCVPKEEMEIESYFNKLMGEWGNEANENEETCDQCGCDPKHPDPDCDCTAHTEAEEPGEQKTPLSEFILSFYDRANGSFPKGETAVLTMVEKDYGEEFIEPAKTFIGSVNQTFEQYQTKNMDHASLEQAQPQDDGRRGEREFVRMRSLAGL